MFPLQTIQLWLAMAMGDLHFGKPPLISGQILINRDFDHSHPQDPLFKCRWLQVWHRILDHKTHGDPSLKYLINTSFKKGQPRRFETSQDATSIKTGLQKLMIMMNFLEESGIYLLLVAPGYRNWFLLRLGVAEASGPT